ncbi:fibrous sheath CABYR-binding protein [Cyclospora cayetanensis]|uniref:Fibrous sheath CABYR-binding protein n=2 Tax=Cyclospora cayetanensis TaxID=88456 RepID=A0A6P5WDV0_9EIME|nr:fibrous sheath CABYR-binding protein [Cyclospora cayetanensis]OEH79175.1 hypothetical protein cyc_01479 [Cyclospora cayetanensis]
MRPCLFGLVVAQAMWAPAAGLRRVKSFRDAVLSSPQYPWMDEEVSQEGPFEALSQEDNSFLQRDNDLPEEPLDEGSGSMQEEGAEANEPEDTDDNQAAQQHATNKETGPVSGSKAESDPSSSSPTANGEERPGIATAAAEDTKEASEVAPEGLEAASEESEGASEGLEEASKGSEDAPEGSEGASERLDEAPTGSEETLSEAQGTQEQNDETAEQSEKADNAVESSLSHPAPKQASLPGAAAGYPDQPVQAPAAIQGQPPPLEQVPLQSEGLPQSSVHETTAETQNSALAPNKESTEAGMPPAVPPTPVTEENQDVQNEADIRASPEEILSTLPAEEEASQNAAATPPPPENAEGPPAEAPSGRFLTIPGSEDSPEVPEVPGQSDLVVRWTRAFLSKGRAALHMMTHANILRTFQNRSEEVRPSHALMRNLAKNFQALKQQVEEARALQSQPATQTAAEVAAGNTL